MKTDARVKYTQKVVKDALLGLLETKPVNRITVKEVCVIAGINRATFYSHFSDCFDVLEKIENDLLEDFEKSLAYVNAADVSELISAIYDMIDANAGICRVLVFHSKDSALLTRMLGMAHDKTMSLWRRQLKKAGDAELEMLFICLSSGLMNVLVTGYQKFERSEVIKFVNDIARNSLRMYM